MENTMRKQKGFSLIELLIVVAIILIIAAIAIPNLLRSRIAANESSAVGSVRSINTAQVTYASTYPDVGFAATLTALGPVSAPGAAPTSANSGLLDAVLGCAAGAGPCPKSGYNFTMNANLPTNGVAGSSYSINGDPITPGQSGQRYFYSDPSGVIRSDPAAAATEASTPLQ